MSIILSHSDGWILSHVNYLRSVYNGVSNSDRNDHFHFDKYFDINETFTRGNKSIEKNNKKRKKSVQLTDEAMSVERQFHSLMKCASEKNIFAEIPVEPERCTNDSSRLAANLYFQSIRNLGQANGENNNDFPITAKINEDSYLFPANCKFLNGDIIFTIGNNLKGCKYDFILLDPPWYNRFVKRRKKYHPEHGYHFLDDSKLSKIPIEELLRDDSGLVAVWTTNSISHIETVTDVLFPLWGLQLLSTWFWIKVTKYGELVVPFSSENGKQPYERLIFGGKAGAKFVRLPENNKCIVSVPSSIHSHKPPLSEVMKDYIREESKCLEIFGRYLTPGWTSCGNQVISLQLASLYNNNISC